jgi:hypothetical protein
VVPFLIALAVLGAVIGLLTVTQATQGVWAVAAACLFAILARIAQAGVQHREMVQLMRAGLGLTDPRPAAPPGAWICARCQRANGPGLFDCAQCGAARPRAERTTLEPQ